MTAFLDDDLYGFDTFTERVMSELEGGDIVNIMPYDDGLYLSFAEEILPTRHPKINISKVREYDFDEVLKNETELEELSYSYDSMAIVKKMKDIVPEFISQHSIYEVLDLKNN